MLTSFEVVYQGVPKKMVEWLKGHRTSSTTVRDLLELTGSLCLGSCFEDRYREYPIFTSKLTVSNLKQPTEDVIRWLVGGVKNQLANAVLDGLELLDSDKLRPQNSRYAKAVLAKLDGKPPGQVVNRKELISVKNDVDIESQYQIEPELLLVVLLALVQNGNISLSLTGKKLDAANISDASKTPIDTLLQFKHIEKPKGLPLAELVALFELLELSEGLIRNPDTHEDAVKELKVRSNKLTEEVVTSAQQVQTGLPCWGRELISGQERDHYQQKLDDLKGFLESLQAFNTPGKLKNFSRTITEIQAQKANLDLVKQVEELNDLVQELTPITGYLATATAVLPPQDPWRDQMESTRASWRAKLLDPALRGRPDFRQIINRALQKAKDEYKTTYDKLHKKARLQINEDEKKKALLKDSRLDQLKKLAAGISLLPHASLTELQTRLAKLTPCYTLVRDDLETSPICPHCNFRPQEETLGASGLAVLQQIDGQLDTTLENWRKTLVDNLSDPTAKKSISLLPSGQKAAVEGFLKTKQLPEKIDADLVQGIQTALSGLIAMNVIPADLLDSLSAGGAPCTVEQLRTRFEEFLQKITRGREAAKVRLIIVRGEAGEAPP